MAEQRMDANDQADPVAVFLDQTQTLVGGLIMLLALTPATMAVFELGGYFPVVVGLAELGFAATPVRRTPGALRLILAAFGMITLAWGAALLTPGG